MSSPRVSVVVAAYNHAAFVRECIESVQAQTFTDWELVVTDDGSHDGTADILRELAASDRRIRFHGFAVNQGACIAVNDAIARARGEFIAVLNSDDRWRADKLALQVAFLERHPECGAVFAKPRLIDERGAPFTDAGHKDYLIFEEANRSRQAWLDHFFHAGNCLCHPSVLIRRSCYDHVGCYDPRLAQLPDLDMWVRLCAHYEIHILDAQLVDFRILDGERNASAARPEVLAREPWERLQVLRHYLSEGLDGHVSPLPHPAQPPDEPSPRLRLAWTALAIGTPAHRALALEILHRALAPGEPVAAGAPELSAYLRLTGETDLFWQRHVAICHQLQRDVETLQDVVARQRAELASVNQALDLSQSRHASAEAALRDIQSSRSWTMTAPLRWLVRRVSGLRRKGRE
ncbi:glycosyltransferase family 2 protein [Marichromatium gracile]|uniref:glycosyltransferase family 2 protein n=1 Tax=Marichromatium gracile TaxID=1048 RepID=UPI0009EE4498|nr:glycosyltransferase [Marichromatium gracile]